MKTSIVEDKAPFTLHSQYQCSIMTWQHNKPRHQQLWYFPKLLRIIWALNDENKNDPQVLGHFGTKCGEITCSGRGLPETMNEVGETLLIQVHID